MTLSELRYVELEDGLDDLEALAEDDEGGYAFAHQFTDHLEEALEPDLVADLDSQGVDAVGFLVVVDAAGVSLPEELVDVEGPIRLSVRWFLTDGELREDSPAIHAVARDADDDPAAFDGDPPEDVSGQFFVAHFTGPDEAVDADGWESSFGTELRANGNLEAQFSTAEAMQYRLDEPFQYDLEAVWIVYGCAIEGTVEGHVGTVDYKGWYRHLEWLLGELGLRGDDGDGPPPPAQTPEHPFRGSIPNWSTDEPVTDTFSVPPGRDGAIDAIVSATIDDGYDEYRNLEVDLEGETITVEPVYFNNDTRNPSSERQRYGFDDTVDATSDEFATLEAEGGQMRIGRAMELGKVTPGEFETFLQEAIDHEDDPIADHADLEDDEDLGKDELEAWIEDVQMGLDCSALVQYLIIECHEALDDELDAFDPVAEPDPQERRAATFVDGGGDAEDLPDSEPVPEPADLRPGDVWFLGTGIDHVRLVSSARAITDEDGERTMEIETVESAGTQDGPARRTWQTESLETFGTIEEQDGTESHNTVGDNGFYRPEELIEEDE